MTEEFVSQFLKNSKNLLVYFNAFNRHLYRYTGFEMLKKLFKKSFPDRCIQLIFDICCKYNHHKLCKILLEDERLDPSFNNNVAIRYATINNNPRVVELLLKDSRIDPTVCEWYIIYGACIAGHIDIIKLFLNDKRFDASVNNNIYIRCAAYCGFLELVKYLLQDTRVDPSADINSAICSATKKGHIEVVKLLLEDPRVDAREALEIARENNHSELIHLLSNKKTKHLYYPYIREHRLLQVTLIRWSEK